ncbi:MAG: hypothetical protein ACI9VS_002004 [Candidatus Binatia bacterium]|mgnify:CR=1 FL=1|jgi:hypothetical protein
MRKTGWLRGAVLAVLLGWLAMMVAGCQTTRKVNWDDRVGTATYSEALNELGPADKFAQLSDGSLVAQWLYRRGEDRLAHKLLYGGGPSDIKDTARLSDKYLNLTFGSDRKLRSWRWSYK